MLALGHEVPAVVIGLAAGVVVHKHLVQGLQGQEAVVIGGGGVVGLGPLLGDEGVQHAGLDHLGLDLVAVLDQGHGEGAGVLQGVGGELVENFVVLGLLPLELHIIAGVDGLQILDEQGQGALAAAGVAHAIEHLAVGLLNGLLGKLLHGHALGLLNDLLGGGQVAGLAGAAAGAAGAISGAVIAAGYQSQAQGSGQDQRDQSFQLFHVLSSFKQFS